MVKVDGAEHAPIARCGDIELYQWDADLLQPRRWLNDALIAFAFEHMAQGLTEVDGVVLIEPTVAFAAAMVPPDTLAEMISGGPAGKARRRLATSMHSPCIHHARATHAPCVHHACTMPWRLSVQCHQATPKHERLALLDLGAEIRQPGEEGVGGHHDP